VRVAVVGHSEWFELLRLERVPRAGEIVHSTAVGAFPGGGGAGPAVMLARWVGACAMYTSFGDDELGHRTHAELRARGVDVHATFLPIAQRRAITVVDAQRERTIIVVGERHFARGSDPLPWDDLAACDAVFVTAGDVAAVRAARRARVLVATSRIVPLLAQAAIPIDALVGSSADAAEAYTRGQLVPEPAVVVRTEGANGGTYTLADGTTQRYQPVPATVTGDSFGAGDAFAAALTLALGSGADIAAALGTAAARAAEVLAYVGPYPPP
jgi:ribokinase